MKQSPFKFQSNNSKKAKSLKAKSPADHDETQGKPPLAPKDLKKAQPKAKSHIQVRTARPVIAQRPQGKG
jgi:hypothetical protein